MFKVGERVFDIRYGWGTVVDGSPRFPIGVIFDSEDHLQYTNNGCSHTLRHRTLYHHDYTPKECEVKGELLQVSESIITKREQFAAMAMQGILSADFKCEYSCDRIAEFSIKMADTLIKALNEK